MSTGKFGNQALLTAINELYLNDSTADVHFVIESDNGESERIPSHKLLLVAYSEVFQVMFNGSWKENDDVKIVDATADAFKEFLQFFYFTKVEITTDNVEEVLRLGQKYLVAECVKASTQLLTDNLTEENVCSVYGLSILADQKELKKLCEVIIGLNASAVFKTSGFLKCDRQIISHILKLDSLSCSEMKIFKASMAWVRATSNRKTLDKDTVLAHLGDSFYDIRFGAMTTDEVNGIFQSNKNLFPAAKERTEIVKVITSEDIESKLIKKHPRKCSWDEEEVAQCRRRTGYDRDPHYVDYESTTFMTNAPVLLRALVFGEILEHLKFKWIEKVDDDVTAELNIIEYRGASAADKKNSRIIYTDREICLNEERSRRNIVELSKPVIIKPGSTYEISYDLSDDFAGGRYCTTFRMCSNEVVIKPGTTIKFTDKYNDGRGLLYGLHFSPV